MRVWIVKPDLKWPQSAPDDVVCFEIGDGRIVFVQGDGMWDVAHMADGMPTASMWDVHGEPIE